HFGGGLRLVEAEGVRVDALDARRARELCQCLEVGRGDFCALDDEIQHSRWPLIDRLFYGLRRRDIHDGREPGSLERRVARWCECGSRHAAARREAQRMAEEIQPRRFEHVLNAEIDLIAQARSAYAVGVDTVEPAAG